MDQQNRSDPVEKARDLGPAVVAAADELERTRRIPASLLEQLYASRLLRMLLPRSVDGDQIDPMTYLAAIEELSRHDGSIGWNVFVANSSALIHYRSSHLHYVRPGILLYGGSPNGQPRGLHLKPVMTLKSRVLQIKEVPAGVEVSYGGTYITPRRETLAIIPVGYANGYPRSLSNQSSVLIGGRRFPLLGRVCMNLIVVRVDKALSLKPGEEVVLMGSQGQESISAEELARQADTISYELFCCLGRMNPRKYS